MKQRNDEALVKILFVFGKHPENERKFYGLHGQIKITILQRKYLLHFTHLAPSYIIEVCFVFDTAAPLVWKTLHPDSYDE